MSYTSQLSKLTRVQLLSHAPQTTSTQVGLHVSCRYYSSTRESRFLQKLMSGSSKKKKWFNTDQGHGKALKEFNFFAAASKVGLPPGPPKVFGTEEPEKVKMPTGRVARRVGVLNTVFLEHITSILATGELKESEDVLGMGLEISAVYVTPDFKNVNVYWYTTGSPEKEAYLQDVLKRLGPRVRHSLISLRVMGNVPPIQFVKDTKQAQLIEVERLFETVDYGEDFVPTKGANLFRPPPSVIPEEVKEKIEILEGKQDSESDGSDTDAKIESEAPKLQPETSILDPQFMRQDILGLKRDKIMKNIMDLMANRKQRQNAENRGRPDPEQQDERAEESTEKPITAEQIARDVQNQHARTEMFVKYLKMKQMERSRRDKLESTSLYERKFYEKVREERVLAEMKERADESEDRLFKKFTKDEEEDYLSEPENESDLSDSHDRR